MPPPTLVVRGLFLAPRAPEPCLPKRTSTLLRLRSLPIHLGRRLIAQRLVRPLLVVVAEVGRQPRRQRRHLHEHIVQAATLAIHAHLGTRRLHPSGERRRRELHALVG